LVTVYWKFTGFRSWARLMREEVKSRMAWLLP